jgi:OOP family OmpA-OmpF porin
VRKNALLLSSARLVAAVSLAAFMGTGCSSLMYKGAPHPALCGAIGAVLGATGGSIYAADNSRHRDVDEAIAGGAIGAVALGLPAALLCYFLQHEEPPPPPPPAKAPAPAPRPTAEKIVLRGVNFDFDKATIRPDAKVILDEAATQLSKNPDVRVSVEGHTDSVGKDAYNQKLSERRAGSVKSYLVGKGVSESRLSTVGYGESKPVASNNTKDGRALNRRVELLVK